MRAKENVKGRTVLSMESTLARMNRLGSSVLMGVPLLTLDEIVASIDAVTLEQVSSLARELFDPDAHVRRRRGRRREQRSRPPSKRSIRRSSRRDCIRGVINVAVSGAAGPDGADGLRCG